MAVASSSLRPRARRRALGAPSAAVGLGADILRNPLWCRRNLFHASVIELHRLEPHLEPSTYADQRQLTLDLSQTFDAIHRPSHWRDAQGRFRWGHERLIVTPAGKPPGAPPGVLAIEIFGISYAAPQGPLRFEAPVAFYSWFTFNVQGGITQDYDEGGTPIRTTFVAEQTGPDGVGRPADLFGEVPLPTLLPPQVAITGGRPAELLELPEPVVLKLQAFAQAQEGDPTAASGLVLRMLYFSASTVTTLGLGDIQPLTPLARTLVTLEAILGLVFIGLFLNALASRARGDANPE
jgi:hypothetical protein